MRICSRRCDSSKITFLKPIYSKINYSNEKIYSHFDHCYGLNWLRPGRRPHITHSKSRISGHTNYSSQSTCLSRQIRQPLLFHARRLLHRRRPHGQSGSNHFGHTSPAIPAFQCAGPQCDDRNKTRSQSKETNTNTQRRGLRDHRRRDRVWAQRRWRPSIIWHIRSRQNTNCLCQSRHQYCQYTHIRGGSLISGCG